MQREPPVTTDRPIHTLATFIDFSEASVDWQLKRELRKLELEHAEVIIEDPYTDAL